MFPVDEKTPHTLLKIRIAHSNVIMIISNVFYNDTRNTDFESNMEADPKL